MANVTDLGRKAKQDGEDLIDSASRAADRMADKADDALDDLADEMQPERRYSFHALVAAGLAGYVVGRLFSN
ncbi:hypothetical protein MWN34_07940 [Ancylobacter sp. 6x-1]|uniref:DUF883 family protein n=1 Tax=Ancylobacter crimeensis TaxID=2579147 RepID=A0ABT0DA81_9HYPH|nr:hypothetical protein [Ancylobacter crimeensis]MCK0196842.1 hypothetical protein [Ancylobacter crimeensis]